MQSLGLVAQDIRYGLRQLVKSPGFTIVAALSLALGIGANTAIFQLVNAIRLKSLPVRDPQSLVTIDFEPGSSLGGQWSTRSARMTYTHFDELRRQQNAFTGLAAWSAAQFDLTSGGVPRFAEGLYVNGDFFPQLGVPAMIGRTFTTRDDDLSCPSPGALLSYAFWQREFGGNPHILGRSLNLNSHPFPIIGVTGPEFFGVEVGNRFDVAIPLCADRVMSDDGKGRIPVRHAFWLSAIGRLRPGVTANEAKSRLHALSPAIMRATLPPVYKADQIKRYLKNRIGAETGGTGVSGLRRQYETSLWLLMAATGLILLIACANLANLLLARASVREREVAVRLAIGASRARLVTQLLVESLLLAFLGSVLGVALAQVLSRGLVLFLNSTTNPVFIGMGMDWRVLGFTAALMVITCLLFGLAPALRATYLSPAAVIRSGGRSMTASRERFSLRRGLVTVQVALSLVLLVGALLFVRSLHNLVTVDAGFQKDGLLTVGVDYSRAQYSKSQRPFINHQLRERLAALPGVTSAASVWFTPISGSGWNNDIGPDGTVAAASGKEAFFNRVGPDYFKTMGTGLIAGREFSEHDTVGSPKVAIVNEEFARKFFKGANPVGRTFRQEAEAGKPEPLFQIIGLVRNTKYYELREDFRPVGFFPVAQDDNPGPGLSFVVRFTGSPAAAVNNVKSAIDQINPSMGVQLRWFSDQIQDSLLRERLMATLSLAFGLLAGILATVGLYGVIAYLVTRRRSEIGVRIALGAGRNSVIQLVLREAVLLLAAGFAVGTLLSLWAGKTATALLFGVKPYNPRRLWPQRLSWRSWLLRLAMSRRDGRRLWIR